MVLLAPMASAEEPVLFHVPLITQSAGEPMVVRISGEGLAQLGQLELYYRRIGRSEWRSLGFELRQDGEFVAVVPGAEVLPPGLEYHIAIRRGETVRSRFASAAAPHSVVVVGDSSESRMERELARVDGQRSRARVMGGLDNFGARGSLPDYMWAVEADFTYRVLTTLRTLRFGIQRMRAEGIAGGEGVEAGYDHGFAEIELEAHELFAVRGQVQLGANQTQFTAGGVGTLRFGMDPGTHVDAYFGGAAGVGLFSGVNLHWATVPGVPMYGGVEITDWPTESLWAVRLRYGLEVPLGENLDVLGRVTYQARTAVYGGIGGGLGVAWSF